MRAFAEHFGRVGFRKQALMPAYGMAEATLAISFHKHDAEMITDRVDAASLRRGKAMPASEGGTALASATLSGGSASFDVANLIPGAHTLVATYGGDEWVDLALERAIPSAAEQAPFVHAHRGTLHEARNEALGMVATEWVVFLDADDELKPGVLGAIIDRLDPEVAKLQFPLTPIDEGGQLISKPLPSLETFRRPCEM